jgi:hypothetical protein
VEVRTGVVVVEGVAVLVVQEIALRGAAEAEVIKRTELNQR